MTELFAFHSKPAIKTKYLARVENHIAMDKLIRGIGWDDGRGCAVGCTLEAYDHSLYPIELGIPQWLAHVEDTIFEGMSLEKSKTWPRDFLVAITPGDNLERVKGPFLIMVLQSTLETFDHGKFPAVKAAIDGSIALWKRNDIGSPDWNKAAAAAGAAAARAAAAGAAEAAWAAWAAGAAAARAAARAAEAAAWAAAGAAAARAAGAAEAEAAAARAAGAAEAEAEAAAARAAEAEAAAARAAAAGAAEAAAARAAARAEAAEAAEAAWAAAWAAKYDYFADQLLILLINPTNPEKTP